MKAEKPIRTELERKLREDHAVRLRGLRDDRRGVTLMRALHHIKWPIGDVHAGLMQTVRTAILERRYSVAREILSTLRTRRLIEMARKTESQEAVSQWSVVDS